MAKKQRFFFIDCNYLKNTRRMCESFKNLVYPSFSITFNLWFNFEQKQKKQHINSCFMQLQNNKSCSRKFRTMKTKHF